MKQTFDVIIAIQMPKCCAKCPLSERTTAWDQKEEKEVVGYVCDIERSFFMREDDAAKERAHGCHIKGTIPSEHGRLIDADAYQYYGDLADEPTIVPSTRKESE